MCWIQQLQIVKILKLFYQHNAKKLLLYNLLNKKPK